MINEQEFTAESIRVFSAFCDDTRIKVLELLQDGEKTAASLLKEVNIRQSTLSHHMKILVESGIVRTRKAGKRIYYSICESGGAHAVELLKQITNLSIDGSFEQRITNQIIEIKDGHFMAEISGIGSFSIMVDTSCDLPPEFIAEHGIEKLPLGFDLDGRQHNGGYWQEIEAKDFYDGLRNGKVAKTTQITPLTFSIIFSEYAKQGRDLLVLTLSSGLSGTFQSSQIALKDVKDAFPGCNIYTVDSISASVGIGLLADIAVKKRGEGLSARETATFLEEKKHNCLGLFTVDDLMYLHRGGRLNKLSAIAGSVLKVKPVLNLTPEGTLAVKDKVRGRKASLELLVEQYKRSVTPGAVGAKVYIAHTDCEGEALALAGMLRESAGVEGVTVIMMGPVIGAHVGPGTILLFFEGDITRKEYENIFYSKQIK